MIFIRVQFPISVLPDDDDDDCYQTEKLVLLPDIAVIKSYFWERGKKLILTSFPVHIQLFAIKF